MTDLDRRAGFECAGYALSVVALAGAPVSLVAVMMQGGIALFVLFAIRFLGERAGAGNGRRSAA